MPKLQLLPLRASSPKEAKTTPAILSTPQSNQIATSNPSDIQTCSNCKVPTTEPPKPSIKPVGLSLPEKLIYPDDNSNTPNLKYPNIDVRFTEKRFGSTDLNDSNDYSKPSRNSENARNLAISNLDRNEINTDKQVINSLNLQNSNSNNDNNVPQFNSKLSLNLPQNNNEPNNLPSLDNDYEYREKDYTTSPPVLSPTENENENENINPTAQSFINPKSQQSLDSERTPNNTPQSNLSQNSTPIKPQSIPLIVSEINLSESDPTSGPASQNTLISESHSIHENLKSESGDEDQNLNNPENQQNIPLPPSVQTNIETFTRTSQLSPLSPSNIPSLVFKPKSSLNSFSNPSVNPTRDSKIEFPLLTSSEPSFESQPQPISSLPSNIPIRDSDSTDHSSLPKIPTVRKSQTSYPSAPSASLDSVPESKSTPFNSNNENQNANNQGAYQPSSKLEIQPLAYVDSNKQSNPYSNEPTLVPISLPQPISAKDKNSNFEKPLNYASPRNEVLKSPENFIRNNLPSRYNVPELDNQLDGLLYQFKYAVGYHGHSERSDKVGNKAGAFYSIGRDGFKRTIEYTADGEGFRPKILWERVPEDDIPREETEKELGLKEYEFKWFYLR